MALTKAKTKYNNVVKELIQKGPAMLIVYLRMQCETLYSGTYLFEDNTCTHIICVEF